MSFASCQIIKKTTEQLYSYTPQSILSYKPDTLNISQLDSVSNVDNIPNFKKWKQSTFKDAESGSNYIYRVLVNPNNNIVYTIKQLSVNKFVLLKKQIQSEN